MNRKAPPEETGPALTAREAPVEPKSPIRPTDRRVLIGVRAIPGQGGAATAAYELLGRMQEDGVDAWFVSMVSDELVDFYRYTHGNDYANPDGLPNVLSCVMPWRDILARTAHEPLAALIEEVSPDVVIGTDVVPTLLLGNSAPDRTLVFLTAGSEQAARYLKLGRARDLVSLIRHLETLDRPPEILQTEEEAAVRMSDLVVTHAESIGELYRRFYPFDEGKVYARPVWYAEWILRRVEPYLGLSRPWEERDYDVLFVANRWARIEKNYPMVRRIISRCGDLRVAVVGDAPGRPRLARSDRPGTGLPAIHHPFIASEEHLFGLLGRAKCVVVPSILDAAPGVLYEAAALGCNVVASRNCGNWRLCHESLLVDPPRLDVYVERIRRAVRRKLPDGMAYFLQSSSYHDLIDTLAVV